MLQAQHIRSCVRWFAVILLAIAVAGRIHAKRVDYMPDITSDSYWDTHRIGSVRITAVRVDEHGREYVIYELETQISAEPIPLARTILASHLWLGTGPEEPRIAIDDRLVLYEANEGP